MTDTEQKTPHIRALDRGLRVIEHLSQNGRSTLAELRKATGLGNATLFRVLGTLQERNWVRRNIVEGHFELSHSLGDLLGDKARAHPLAELSAPLLLELKSRQAGWPSDVAAVIGAGNVEVVESTRMRGPMAPTRTGLGLRPSLVFSAHGRTVLAFSSEDLRAKHIDKVRATGTREERMWIETGRLDAEIKASQTRGFGMREPMFWQPPFDPGPEIGALALPILAQGVLFGTISLLWIADDVQLSDIEKFGAVHELRLCAVRIAKALIEAGISPPVI